MVRHIPPTIKQLLTLRNPNAFVGPSISSLDHLFDQTYTNARMQGAGTGWLVLTVHPYDFPVYCHLPKCRPDLYVVDSKHSFVCRPSLSLRDPFRDERSELCAQSSPHARSRTEEHHLCRRSSCKATHLSPSVTLNPFFFSHHTQTIGALAALTDELDDNVKAGLRSDSRRCAYLVDLAQPSTARQRARGKS